MTDKKAYWVMPPEVKNVHPALICEIRWSNQRRRSGGEATTSQEIPPPTEDEKSRFLSILGASPSNPAICSIEKPYADMFIPASMSEKYQHHWVTYITQTS